MRLGSEMASFEQAPTFSGMGRYVRDESLVLSVRLQAVEAALDRGVVTRTEIQAHGPLPRPEAFGLVSDQRPTRIPQDFLGKLGALMLRYGWVVYGLTVLFCYFGLSIAGLSPVERILLSTFGGAPLVITIGVVSVNVALGLIDSTAPGARAWRRFHTERDRITTLSAAKRVLAAEKEIRAFKSAGGLEFERLTARAFRRYGFRVEEVGGANDGGVDLLVWKGAFHAIVQCKAHARPLGPTVVRELYGTLAHNKSAVTAYLATKTGVSDAARDWLAGKSIIVLQPDDLINGRL